MIMAMQFEDSVLKINLYIIATVVYAVKLQVCWRFLGQDEGRSADQKLYNFH